MRTLLLGGGAALGCIGQQCSTDAPNDYVISVAFLDYLPAVVNAVFAEAAGGIEIKTDAVLGIDWEGFELWRQAFESDTFFWCWLVNDLHGGRLRLQDTDARIKSEA